MSTPSPSAFLTEGHYLQLRNALDQIDALQKEIDLAKAAGLDVQARQDTLNQQRQQLLTIKNVYFPGRA